VRLDETAMTGTKRWTAVAQRAMETRWASSMRFCSATGNQEGREKRARPAPREKRPGENESAHDAKKENGPRTRDLVMGCGRLRPD
jgi:hypothetical protein